MLSKVQEELKKEKVKKVVITFLSGNDNIIEVSKKTGISHGSVQRYLHDKEYIKSCFPINSDKIISEIDNKLSNNKQEGLSRGGINSSINNNYTKDELGHFTGSRKK